MSTRGRAAVSSVKKLCILVLLVMLTVQWPLAAERPAAKNVILMISDGGGFNTFVAASYYQHGELGKQVYDGFPAEYGCTTTMLESDGTPQKYDPWARWSDFRWASRNALTNSAASATALYTGRKVKGAPIAMESVGKPLVTIGEIAKGYGKSVGVVTSVQFSDATPGALAAHNISRTNRAEIANDMINADTLDVLMGCGNPEYDGNGNERPEESRKDYRRIGGEETWKAVKAGAAGGKNPWTLIQSKADFERLADNGTTGVPERDSGDPKGNASPLGTTLGAPARRVIGIPQIVGTLQSDRSGDPNADPFTVPFVPNVPSLVTMTRGAINVLSRNPNGFFLLVEGGAVDWANHANHMARMIEEQVDFTHAIEAVVQWVDAHSNWDETLLIVTADHETGDLWGPDSGPTSDMLHFPWDPIQNNGKGKMPGYRYHSTGHAGSLVPLFARGRGAELFARLVDGQDPMYGPYVDNTDVFKVMNASLGTGGLETRSAGGCSRPAERQPALSAVR